MRKCTLRKDLDAAVLRFRRSVGRPSSHEHAPRTPLGSRRTPVRVGNSPEERVDMSILITVTFID